MLNVLLLQLPVLNNLQANLPLAAGYLTAYAASQGLLEQCVIDIMPRAIADRGGDALLVAEVVRRQPDVVGLSLYTWNSERTLHLAALIKRQLPQLVVVVGGPEVQRDNLWVLQHPAVDVAVLGEGEQAFCDVLRWQLSLRDMPPNHSTVIPLAVSETMGVPQSMLKAIPGIAFRKEGELVFTEARQGLDDLAVIPSPYLEGYLELAPGDMAFVECSRWCPYRCTFCLYGRNMGSKLGNRLFPVERVLAEVAWAKARGAQAVHFVEANLNLLPYFRQLTHVLQDINADQTLPLYAELRGEHLSHDAVGELTKAGLRVAEVGLQSANPAALRAVERRTDLQKWAIGTRRLYEHGIEVLLDVILGLPGDDAESVLQTLQWIADQDLGPYEVFILQVLPGTVLRERAEQHQLTYQDRPPYYVLATEQLAYAELRALRWELKVGTGFDPMAVEGMPELGVRGWGLGVRRGTGVDWRENVGQAVEAVVVDCAADEDWEACGEELAWRVGAHVTLYVHHFDRTVLEAFAWPIAQANLTTHWDVVIVGSLPAPATIQAMHTAWPHEIGYLDRIAVYQRATPEPAFHKVTPRWTLLVAEDVEVDPLDYEGIAQVVWQVDAARLPDALAQLEARGGAGLVVEGGDRTLRAKVEQWQAVVGWQVWWV